MSPVCHDRPSQSDGILSILDRSHGASLKCRAIHEGGVNFDGPVLCQTRAKAGVEERMIFEGHAGLHDRMPGWGLVRLDPVAGTVRFEGWPRWAEPGADVSDMLPGWPVEFHALEQGPKPFALLDAVGEDDKDLAAEQLAARMEALRTLQVQRQREERGKASAAAALARQEAKEARRAPRPGVVALERSMWSQSTDASIGGCQTML